MTIVQMNEDAVEIAKQLDLEREAKKMRGPLHGMPVLIKDMIATHDGMETTSGSWTLFGTKPSAESTVAVKLREKGLIILGKTSMSEWANFRSLNSSNGWCARNGQLYGGYYPRQDPSGSSSGSAVATDLALSLFAIGTETVGSIVLPSERNNIVGIKPTVGLTSRYMVIPLSERQDTVGPMAMTVKEAAMLLQAIAGPDPKDNYTLASPFGDKLPNYSAACKMSGLEGKRIGIPRNVLDYLGASGAPVLSAFEAATSVIRNAGATIVDNTNFTAYSDFLKSPEPALVEAADFTSGIAAYLASLEKNPNNFRNLKDIRSYTQNDSYEEYPSRDTGVWDEVIAAGINNTSPAFWPMYQRTLYFGEEGGLLGALSRNNLDAVILPTLIASDIPAVVGTPIITVPLGAYPDGTPIEYNARGNLIQKAPGIPFGISFLGPKWSEEALIGMAYAFEQRTLVRHQLGRRY
ncbi:amidase signature enzyme [Aspergillus ellipticus CBS 707.79]|uniref:Amidase signature enzyme n=1 Tax=Aspergillus ellipticus CBS 707.79 TaxID=1448320 RepID=A0A319E2R0_9EURO|nr:amidase signature enzyme [Aspergillus ellipticus CBS 707.79]